MCQEDEEANMNFAKLIVGVLTSDRESLDIVLKQLSERFGKADMVSQWRSFTHTDYYADEMGSNLYRCFVSFEKLVMPSKAVEFKGWTSEIEDEHRMDGRRTVNLDPGYLDSNKVVLVTGKHGGHKIALAPGVWADLLLWYNKGWQALPWAFPDFRDGGWFDTFIGMRKIFKDRIKGEPS